MENKFYCPTFEDFIPNLEYEYFDGREWVKKVYNNLEHRASETMNLHYQLKLNRDRFRIKELDEEDLKELGWSTDEEYDKDALYYRYEKPLEYSCVDIVFPVPGFDSNTEIIDNEGLTIFIGKVKNKTELKRLLKQLGL